MSATSPSGPSISSIPPSPWSGAAPAHRMNLWPLALGGGRAIGILLLFLGTLIAVAFATPPGSCYTAGTTCGSFASGAANAILAGKILWSLGLFCLAATSGIRMQGGLLAGPSAGESAAGWTPRYYANLVVVIVSTLLMFFLILSTSVTIFP